MTGLSWDCNCTAYAFVLNHSDEHKQYSIKARDFQSISNGLKTEHEKYMLSFCAEMSDTMVGTEGLHELSWYEDVFPLEKEKNLF